MCMRERRGEVRDKDRGAERVCCVCVREREEREREST